MVTFLISNWFQFVIFVTSFYIIAKNEIASELVDIFPCNSESLILEFSHWFLICIFLQDILNFYFNWYF